MTPEDCAAALVTIVKRGTFSHLWRVQVGTVLVRDFAFEASAEECATALRQSLAVAIREAVAEIECCSDEPCDSCVACLRRALDSYPEWHDRKLREAVDAETEACARIVCLGCKRDQPVRRGAGTGFWFHDPSGYCAASALRQRAASRAAR